MIHCQAVSKTYHSRKGDVNSLSGINLHVQPGEFVSVRGPSGCGKTTLLLTLGGMLHPTSGTVTVHQHNLYKLDAKTRASFRAAQIGFVFQMFHLVPYLNVLDNVLLAAHSVQNNHAQPRATQLLDELGLSNRLNHTPAELSAGERQRTAIARALLNQPKVILADEPTGNLDPDNATEVFQHLHTFHQAGGTVIVVTHGPIADDYSTRVLHLRDGRLVP